MSEEASSVIAHWLQGFLCSLLPYAMLLVSCITHVPDMCLLLLRADRVWLETVAAASYLSAASLRQLATTAPEQLLCQVDQMLHQDYSAATSCSSSIPATPLEAARGASAAAAGGAAGDMPSAAALWQAAQAMPTDPSRVRPGPRALLGVLLQQHQHSWLRWDPVQQQYAWQYKPAHPQLYNPWLQAGGMPEASWKAVDQHKQEAAGQVSRHLTRKLIARADLTIGPVAAEGAAGPSSSMGVSSPAAVWHHPASSNQRDGSCSSWRIKLNLEQTLHSEGCHLQRHPVLGAHDRLLVVKLQQGGATGATEEQQQQALERLLRDGFCYAGRHYRMCVFSLLDSVCGHFHDQPCAVKLLKEPFCKCCCI